MHQTNLGIFKHIRTCINRKYQSTNPDVLENLDDRLREIKENHRLGRLKVLRLEPPYFRKCTNIPTAKHKAAFQVILALSHGMWHTKRRKLKFPSCCNIWAIICAGELDANVQRALPLTVDWQKYACPYEYSDEDVRQMMQLAQR